jgi:hypothetical protein
VTEARIDPEAGALVLGSVPFGPGLGEDQFLKSEHAAARIPRSGTRHFYEIWESSGDPEIGLTLRFVPRGKLEQIHLKLVRHGTRASSWSKSREDGIKQFHDAWLKTQLGDAESIFGVSSYQFSWGRVASVVEQPHAYAANIVIDYTRNGQRRSAFIALARAARHLGLNSLGRRLLLLALR